MDNLHAQSRDLGKQNQKAKKEQECSERLFDLCNDIRTCLEQLKDTLSFPDLKAGAVSKEMLECKLKLGINHSKINKTKWIQVFQKNMIVSLDTMVKSFIKDMTKMSEKIGGFQNLELNDLLNDLLANISDMQSKMSGFIKQNFEQFEKERKEKESTHGNVVPPDKPKVPTAEQIHYQAEITIQSYKHLQHAKQQYVSQIDKIREVCWLHYISIYFKCTGRERLIRTRLIRSST